MIQTGMCARARACMVHKGVLQKCALKAAKGLVTIGYTFHVFAVKRSLGAARQLLYMLYK